MYLCTTKWFKIQRKKQLTQSLCVTNAVLFTQKKLECVFSLSFKTTKNFVFYFTLWSLFFIGNFFEFPQLFVVTLRSSEFKLWSLSTWFYPLVFLFVSTHNRVGFVNNKCRHTIRQWCSQSFVRVYDWNDAFQRLHTDAHYIVCLFVCIVCVRLIFFFSPRASSIKHDAHYIVCVLLHWLIFFFSFSLSAFHKTPTHSIKHQHMFEIARVNTYSPDPLLLLLHLIWITMYWNFRKRVSFLRSYMYCMCCVECSRKYLTIVRHTIQPLFGSLHFQP